MKTKIKNFKLYIAIILVILALCISYFAYTQKDNILSLESQNKVENILPDKEFEVKEKSLSVLMVGDIMTDRYIRKQINIAGNAENFVKNYLNNLSEVNKNYYYVVANLEGPITESKSKSLNSDGTYGKDLLFTFPTSTIQILNLLNIKIVSLANNHTDNFYYKGYKETQEFLKEANIKYFGNPYNTNLDSYENLSETLCQNEICVAYIGYNQFTKNNDSDRVVKEIERLKDLNKENLDIDNLKENKLEESQLENSIVDFIIIMPHWGEEYEKQANKNQEKLAREWIDAGADAIIGAHPHVIQNSEVYKGKYIYYSLGNYIFDQWFNSDVQNGLGVNIIFKKVSIGKEGDAEHKVEKSISIKEENNKNIFIDRNGVRYR